MSGCGNAGAPTNSALGESSSASHTCLHLQSADHTLCWSLLRYAGLLQLPGGFVGLVLQHNANLRELDLSRCATTGCTL